LFHGNDISYSLCIPTTYLKNLTVKQSYEKISLFILKFYKNLGLNPIYAKDDKNIQLKKDKFCQIGFEPYDILIDGKKIGGNAQRRDKKVIFQHGSINIKSYNKKEKYGYSLEDFGVNLTFDDAKDKLIKAFKQTFDTFEKA
jgi:lipoate-protein ligase A